MDLLPLYLFALAAGAPLLLWFTISGDDGGDSGGLFPMVSFMALAYVAAFFGASGVLLTLVGMGAVVTLLASIGIGVAAGVLNSAFFSWLRRSSVSSDVTDRDIEGAIARVSLPMSPKRRGRIILEVAGMRTQMTARSVEGSGDVVTGDRVIVVGVESNVALCSPLDADLQ